MCSRPSRNHIARTSPPTSAHRQRPEAQATQTAGEQTPRTPAPTAVRPRMTPRTPTQPQPKHDGDPANSPSQPKDSGCTSRHGNALSPPPPLRSSKTCGDDQEFVALSGRCADSTRRTVPNLVRSCGQGGDPRSQRPPQPNPPGPCFVPGGRLAAAIQRCVRNHLVSAAPWYRSDRSPRSGRGGRNSTTPLKPPDSRLLS
jgi:hypothetical protein